MTRSVRAEGASTRDAVMRVYLSLREGLVNGSISEDTVLLEGDIGTEYGVSRTPVREALARLEQDGFIERGPRGFRQRSVSASLVVHMWETRIALETAAAAAAAERHTQFEFARLNYLQDELTTTNLPELQAALRNQFHETLWAAAHNPSMTEFIERVFLQLRVFDRKVHSEQGEAEQCIVEHARIIDAIAGRDPRAASAAMDEHLSRLQQSRIGMLAREPY